MSHQPMDIDPAEHTAAAAASGLDTPMDLDSPPRPGCVPMDIDWPAAAEDVYTDVDAMDIDPCTTTPQGADMDAMVIDPPAFAEEQPGTSLDQELSSLPVLMTVCWSAGQH